MAGGRISPSRAAVSPTLDEPFQLGGMWPRASHPALQEEWTSMVEETDIAIIGAGAAGIGAARRPAGSGLATLLLEALPRPGGRCLDEGCHEPQGGVA